MIELFKNANYDFIGRRRWAYVVSGLITLIALGSLLSQGLRFDLDFTGGTLIQVRFAERVDDATVRAALTTGRLGDSIIQQFGDAQEYIIRTSHVASTTGEVAQRIHAALSNDRSLQFEIRRVEVVGPQVGHELQMRAVYAVTAGLIGILAYIGLRFDLKGAVAAITAVIHDVVVCLGALALTRLEFSLPVLAALLTVVGYSVNDTIVAYDRLRENRAKVSRRTKPFADQMNDAINQTLSRTILTSLTTFMAAAVLLALGGSSLEGFAFVLTVGVVAGTYSTIYISAALVVDWTIHVEREQSGQASERTASPS